MSNLEISRAQRLDQKVIELLPELSRAFAVKLIEQGKVTINGTPQTKAGYKMRGGEDVVVDYVAEDDLQIPDIEIPIIYEDDECVVIHKPIGLLTHSKGAFNPEATVATWLRRRLARGEWDSTTDQSGNARAGIVHRLDRATSGVMICAKTPDALKHLQKQFSQRKAKKTYQAIVKGEFKQEHAIIDIPIERNPKRPQTFRVGINGKSAVTEYQVLQTGLQRSLVEMYPQTGRTHQFRVHLHYLGHPIMGDVLYDGEKADRLYLHAYKLELTLPNKTRTTFEAPIPESFKDALVKDD